MFSKLIRAFVIFPYKVLRLMLNKVFLATALILLAFLVATLTIPTLNNFASNVVSSVGNVRTVSQETKSRLEEAKTQNDALTMLNEELTASLATRQAELTEAQAQSAALQDDLNTQMQTRASLEMELNKAQDARFIMLNGARVQLDQAVIETASAVSNRLSNAASRSFDSLAARSLPYWGLFANRAVTMADKAETCKTLTDLRTLASAAGSSVPTSDAVEQVCGFSVPAADAIWSDLGTDPSAAWQSLIAVADSGSDLPDATFDAGWTEAFGLLGR